MANQLFELYATLGLDTSAFEQALSSASASARQQWQQVSDYLARQQRDDQNNTSRFSRFMQQQGQSVKDALSNMFTISAGNLLTQAINGVTQAVKEFASEAIEAASSLNEVQNVVDVTFGDNASVIDNWAKSAKNSFGISETKAKQYTGTLGALMKSMGVADDAVVSMSTDLAGLAGDMASFYNLDYDTAFEKIRSGISGETEPLKALGINMSVANLNAYALSKGLTKTYDAMTQAEQATLRYQYILDATTDAQGDFARTNDEYANAVRLLETNLDSFKASVGQGLLDIVTPAINAINTLFETPGVSETVQSINSMFATENNATADATSRYEQAKTLIERLQEMEEKQGDAAHETDEWAATLKSLSNIMPDLAKDIDLSTSSLKVNTEKLLENAEAAKQAAIYNARLKTVEESKDIVTEAEDKVTAAMKDKFTAEAEYNYWDDTYNDIVNRAMRVMGTDEDSVKRSLATANLNGYTRSGWINAGFTQEDLNYFDAVVGARRAAAEKIATADAAVAQAEEDLAYAKQIQEQTEKSMEAWTSGEGSAAKAQANYNDAINRELDLITQVEDAYKSLTDYRNKAIESARKTLDGYLDGYSELSDSIYDTDDDGNKTGFHSDSINDLINNASQQEQFANAYTLALNEARDKGVSDAVLAAFADGSEESLSRVLALGQASEEDIAKLNAQYEQLQTAKDILATALGDITLAVDDEYNTLKDNLGTLIDELNQEDAARNAMLATGNGILDAMDTTIIGMQERVNAMISLLNALDLGVVSLSPIASVTGSNSGGTVSTGTTGTQNAVSNAKGIDYVPYDDYLTNLHKGEAVLPRVEAEAYRAGSSNTQGIDYNRLAVTLASALAGATVQMDGQTVGVLIAPVVSGEIERKATAGRYA